MMNSRKLTGNWYIKKTFFGFKIMVEAEGTTACTFDFSSSPRWRSYQKATPADLKELEIIIH